MILINRIEIEAFRSIRHASIDNLRDFTAFAGLNNSGKSNVLRALNAFFNDETDYGQPVDVDLDYFRPDHRKKKRKRIRISLTFELPDNFRFRKGLEGVQALLGDSGKFTITKEWVRDNPLPAFSLNGTELTLDDRQKLLSFLQLIKYRYVPNRVLPIDLIRNEHQSLRDVLIRRLAKRAKGDEKAFEAIKTTSERMVESLSRRFEEACPTEGAVSLATPTSWSDLAFTFGYRLSKDGIEIKDSEQGSGIQSLLMLETLYLIDRDYFQQFGWRQAAIWGLEEPESSLHTSLEARIASYLADVATEPQSRLQIFCTTHSDLVVQYAGSTVVVERDGGESQLEPVQDPRVALQKLSSGGVSRWVHPILFWPLDPIVLVEGKFDAEFFKESLRHVRLRRPIRIVDLPALDGDIGGGGIERMRSYIKDNASAIASRRVGAPVVAVLDWDAAGKLGQFSKLVNRSEIYKVLAWDEQKANPRAGKSFKGIERFHNDRVLDLAIQRDAPIGQKKNGELTVAAAEYERAKVIIGRIVQDGLKESDLKYSMDFVVEVAKAAEAI